MTSDFTDETGEDLQDAPGLRASLEAILLVADEPVPEVVLAQVLERPRGEIAQGLRAARGAVRQGRPGGQAHPGRARNAGGHRLPAASEPGTGVGGARGELRRGDQDFG